MDRMASSEETTVVAVGADRACGVGDRMASSEESTAVQDFGVATSVGACSYMEDFHSHLLLNQMGLFGVFDGHGGIAAAQFCANNMHSEVAARMTVPGADLHQVLTEAFLHIDDCLRVDCDLSRQQTCCSEAEAEAEAEEEEEEEYCTAGSTAVVALIDYCRRTVVVANVGDSRAILCRNGRAFDLATAHDPEDPKESDRIVAAGGKIMPNGYLSTADGSSTLSMSRSIGDFEFKADRSLEAEQQMVVARPDIVEAAFGGDEDFLVLASDGIWMPSQQIVDLVATQKRQCLPSTAICKNLIAIADANDNMTVVIVSLARPRCFGNMI